MRINSGSLYLWLFLGITVGDASSYLVREYYSLPFLSTGFFSAAIVYSMAMICHVSKKFNKFSFFAVSVFLFFIFMAVLLSGNADMAWLLNIFWYFSAFEIGRRFVEKYDFESRAKKMNVICMWTSLMLLVGLLYNYSPGVIAEFNYLRVASGVCVFMFFLLATSNKLYFSVFLYFIGLFVLWVLDSRSWLYIWILSPCLLIFSREKFSLSLLVCSIIFFAIAFSAVLLETSSYSVSLMSESRIFRPLFDIEADASIVARAYYFDLGFSQIIKNPVFGKYNGYYDYSDGGGYIHNILSYWQQFGLVPFLILIASILISLSWLFFNKSDLNSYRFVFLVLLSTFILSIASISYVSFMPFFSLGCVVGYKKLALRSKNKICTSFVVR